MKEEKQDASITAANSRMDRLITALSEARGPSTGPETRERDVPTGVERRRTLGQTPNFITGESDFITHVESFRDFVELNDINQEDKVKRLFLTTLDQKARMRCAGLEPNRAHCLEMSAGAVCPQGNPPDSWQQITSLPNGDTSGGDGAGQMLLSVSIMRQQPSGFMTRRSGTRSSGK